MPATSIYPQFEAFSSDLFIENKYLRWYKGIVLKAQNDLRKKGQGTYYESHHILPKCNFKEFEKSKWNLVLLTAREHFLCHWMLTKCTQGLLKRTMHYALAMFTIDRTYKLERNLKVWQRAIAIRSNAGRPFSEEHKKNHKKASETRKRIDCPICGKNVGCHVLQRHITSAHTDEVIDDGWWITNGTMNKKIPKNSEIPENWWRGQIFKNSPINFDTEAVKPPKEILYKELIIERKSIQMVADEMGFPFTLIRKWQNEYELKKTPKQVCCDREHWTKKLNKVDKGIYITPIGITLSTDGLVDKDLSPGSLNKFCTFGNDVIIGNYAYSRSKFLKDNFTKDVVGKSYREIGFRFVPKDEIGKLLSPASSLGS